MVCVLYLYLKNLENDLHIVSHRSIFVISIDVSHHPLAKASWWRLLEVPSRCVSSATRSMRRPIYQLWASWKSRAVGCLTLDIWGWFNDGLVYGLSSVYLFIIYISLCWSICWSIDLCQSRKLIKGNEMHWKTSLGASKFKDIGMSLWSHRMARWLWALKFWRLDFTGWLWVAGSHNENDSGFMGLAPGSFQVWICEELWRSNMRFDVIASCLRFCRFSQAIRRSRRDAPAQVGNGWLVYWCLGMESGEFESVLGDFKLPGL